MISVGMHILGDERNMTDKRCARPGSRLALSPNADQPLTGNLQCKSTGYGARAWSTLDSEYCSTLDAGSQLQLAPSLVYGELQTPVLVLAELALAGTALRSPAPSSKPISDWRSLP
jgi:hypothetical protein